jgi:MFS family permease
LRFLVGNLCANFGDMMLTTALGWDLYNRTHSALALGWVGLVQFIPVALLALPAGNTADRRDRRKIVLAAYVVVFLCVAGFAATSWFNGPIALYYALLFLLGVAQAYYSPARSALLPGLVPAQDLSHAINWVTSARQLAWVSGPLIAGYLLSLTQHATPVYMIDVVLNGIFLVMLAGIQYEQAPPKQESRGWKDLVAGLHFVWSQPLMLSAITLDMFSVLLGGAVAILPVFARDIFHSGPQGLGWLTAAPYLGSLVLGLVMAHRPPIRRNGPVLLWTVAGFGLATLGFAFSQSIYVGFFMLFLTGAFDMVSMVIRQNLVQMITPDAYRGRVSAVNGVFIGTSNELGGFESGLTAQWWGPIRSVIFGGIGTLVVVSLVALRWPQLRGLHEIKPAEDYQPGD